MKNKPFSQASENNKNHILNVLKIAFANTSFVLEIGSGTGQHAVYFGSNLTHLTWQPSDVDTDLSGINLWLDEANLTNIKTPINLDVNKLPWKVGVCEGVFTANTFQIMAKSEIENFFSGVEQVLTHKGKLCVYGPFNYNGEFTSESNERFDSWLKSRDLKNGIRDFEWANSLAQSIGLRLIKDYDMPANNRLLEWKMES